MQKTFFKIRHCPHSDIIRNNLLLTARRFLNFAGSEIPAGMVCVSTEAGVPVSLFLNIEFLVCILASTSIFNVSAALRVPNSDAKLVKCPNFDFVKNIEGVTFDQRVFFSNLKSVAVFHVLQNCQIFQSSRKSALDVSNLSIA